MKRWVYCDCMYTENGLKKYSQATFSYIWAIPLNWRTSRATSPQKQVTWHSLPWKSKKKIGFILLCCYCQWTKFPLVIRHLEIWTPQWTIAVIGHTLWTIGRNMQYSIWRVIWGVRISQEWSGCGGFALSVLTAATGLFCRGGKIESRLLKFSQSHATHCLEWQNVTWQNSSNLP